MPSHNPNNNNKQNNPRYKKQRDTFLNSKKIIQLPSNLLQNTLPVKKQSYPTNRINSQITSSNIIYKYNIQQPYTHNENTKKIQAWQISQPQQSSSLLVNQNLIKYTECIPVQVKDYNFQSIDAIQPANNDNFLRKSKQKGFRNVRKLSATKKMQTRAKTNKQMRNNNKKIVIQDKIAYKKDRVSLYKRLSGLRGCNQQLKGLSFSKMLSTMIILNQQTNINHNQSPLPYDLSHRLNQTYYKSVKHNNIQLRCHTEQNKYISEKYGSIEQSKDKTGNIFRRYFSPSSSPSSSKLKNNRILKNQISDITGKYVLKDNKKVECLRIHNYYATSRFQKSYEKYSEKMNRT